MRLEKLSHQFTDSFINLHWRFEEENFIRIDVRVNPANCYNVAFFFVKNGFKARWWLRGSFKET